MVSAPPPPSWTVTSVLEASFGLARDNFAAFFTVSLIFGAISLVVDVLSLGLLAGLVHLLCAVATMVCITWGTLHALAGRKPEWEPMLRRVQAPLFGRLLLLGVIQYVVIGLSAVLLLPPFFLLPLWAVTMPAMMVERCDLGAAFWRSADLTQHRRLRILGVFLLWMVIFVSGAAIIVGLLGHGGLARLVLWIYGAFATIVTQPLPAIIYVLLREEKEAVTAAQIAAGID